MPTATKETATSYTWLGSPVGRILVEGDERGLSYVKVCNDERAVLPSKNAIEGVDIFRDAIEQLQAYFAGELKTFDLKLNLQGTDFQLKAWQELQRIPYGQTISYGRQATRMGNPRASRAVGRANGANPISIIIPCHRVVGSAGQLTGFGAGIDVKRWLLEHEAGLFGGARG